ncbi:MAG: alpha/beta fold hydrolase [Pseudomonadota bacterium]
MTSPPDPRRGPWSLWRLIAMCYVALLVVSNTVRLIDPPKRVLSPGQLSISLPVPGRDAGSDATATVAYRDLGPADAAPILLVHGTPVASRAVEPLARQLAAKYRVIVPDMPGFGASEMHIPDYSYATHGVYMQALLDALEITSVHAVGYSQGGGVILSLADQAPERVRSLAMVSAIGVLELELLGDYHANRAVYAAQYGLIVGAKWLLPHFGVLDDMVLSVPYARNLLDSDQRLLRDALEGYAGDMLITHGRSDGFVPLEAALEHHRLVTRSELVLFDGGHLIPIFEPARIAAAIVPFIDRVEAGEALFDATLLAERRQQAAEPFDWSTVQAFSGIRLAVMLLLLAVATYVSEDLACIAAGLLVARGMLEFFPAVGACLVGIFTGDVLLYLGGRLFGAAAVSRAPIRWLVSAERLAQSRAWFERRGAVVLLVSRFVPGTRVPSYVAAGVLGMSIWRFSALLLLAGAIWTPLIVGLAWAAGSSALPMIESYQRYGLAIAVGIAALLWLALRVVLPIFGERGKRWLQVGAASRQSESR